MSDKKNSKWAKNNFDLVLDELQYLNEYAIYYNFKLLDIICHNKGDYRKYFISSHYFKFKKVKMFFIDLFLHLEMELDRHYLERFSSEEIDQIYIGKIYKSYLNMC